MSETAKPSTQDKIFAALAIVLSALFMLASACGGVVFTLLMGDRDAVWFLLLGVLFLALAILLMRAGIKRLRKPNQ